MRRLASGLGFPALWISAFLLAGPAWTQDCNRNGVPDADDLRPSGFGFKSLRVLSGGGPPRSAAAADLDGDGELDLATANHGRLGEPGSTVSVLWNLGGGKFGLPAVLPGGQGPLAVAAADLDGDGDRELVSANQLTKDLSIHFNQGGRAFAPPQGIPMGDYPTSSIPADLDGDGDLDLAVAMNLTSQVKLLFNRGDGGFPRVASVSAGGFLALGDLDGDGDLDLAGASRGYLRVLRNPGDGVFESPLALPVSGDRDSIIARDLDGDRDLDLALGGDSIVVLLNQGNGLFGRPVKYPHWALVSSADLDGDGDHDLLLSELYDYRVSLLRNDGAGAFPERGVVVIDSYGSIAGATGAEDLDRNGAPDLFRPVSGSVEVRLNDRNGAFAQPARYGTGYSPQAVVSGDFNRDGRTDLVTAGWVVSVFLRAEDGSYGEPERFEAQGGHLVAGDFDADGDLDLVVGRGDGSVFSLHNRGDGTFLEAREDLFGGTQSNLAAGDFDGDGALDLAAVFFPLRNGSFIQVILNRGDGTFFEGPATELRERAGSVTAADLDGDGFPDLAVTSPLKNAVTVLANRKNGTFLERTSLVMGTRPRAVTAADLDGDGMLDLAAACEGLPSYSPNRFVGSNLSVALGKGGLEFHRAKGFAVAPGPASVQAADLDGDGRLDLLASCLGPKRLSVLLGRGDGRFLPPLSLELGKWTESFYDPPLAAAVLDLDGSGGPDLVVGDPIAYEIHFLANTTLPAASRDADGDSIPDECGRPAFLRGDVDADGAVTLTDAVSVLQHLFLGAGPPTCLDAADADDDGDLSLTDAVAVLGGLFLGAGPLPEPAGACGPDPTADGLGCGGPAPCGAP